MNNFDLTKYLAESRLYEEDNKSILRTLIQDLEPFEYEVYASDAGVNPEDGAEMEEYIASLSDEEISSEISKLRGINEDKAEGQLNEAMSPQDVVDIADTVAEEFTKESADEGDFLIYTVGRMEGEGFELDTDISAQTPKDLDRRGVGEGWGGIFRIKPSADGYEIRNAEKGGLVAMIDNSGNFRMLSADESRAEMGLEEGEEEVKEIKSNKMKKSELKEMIKAAMLAEMEVEETEVYEAEEDEAEEDEDVEVAVSDEEEIEMDEPTDEEPAEDAGEVDVEDDAKVELTGDKAEVSDNLEAALEAARALGDEKLVDQIGNTITFFTRAHIVKEDELQDEAEEMLQESLRMRRLAGLIK